MKFIVISNKLPEKLTEKYAFAKQIKVVDLRGLINIVCPFLVCFLGGAGWGEISDFAIRFFCFLIGLGIFRKTHKSDPL